MAFLFSCFGKASHLAAQRNDAAHAMGSPEPYHTYYLSASHSPHFLIRHQQPVITLTPSPKTLSCLCTGTPAWLMPSPSTKLSACSIQCSTECSLFFQKWIVLPSPCTRTHFLCAQLVPGASPSKGFVRLRVSVLISVLPFRQLRKWVTNLGSPHLK